MEFAPSSSPPPALDGAQFAWEELVPRTWYARHGHRLLDWVLLCVLLPPALPLMLLIALLNMMTSMGSRPVFFMQPRIGWRGQPFQIIKFRTMKDYAASAHGSWVEGTDRLRVTRFGKFLRNTHLDELPQLINILRGEMSFIGPRPEMVEIEVWASAEIRGFGERLAIRPGVAGLAQVTQGYTGRDLDAYRRKLEINREYLRKMSFALDLSIVVRTIVWMVRGKGWSWNRGAGVTTSATGADHEQRRAS